VGDTIRIYFDRDNPADCGVLSFGFDLRTRGLKSVVMLPLGYRDTGNDWLVDLKKVRRPREQFVTEVK